MGGRGLEEHEDGRKRYKTEEEQKDVEEHKGSDERNEKNEGKVNNRGYDGGGFGENTQMKEEILYGKRRGTRRCGRTQRR